MTIANRNNKKESVLEYYEKEMCRFDPVYREQHEEIQKRLSHEKSRLNHEPLRFVNIPRKDKERILDMVKTVEDLIPNRLVQDAFDLLREVKHKDYETFSNFYTEITYVLNKIDLPTSFKSGSYINLKIEYLCNLYYVLKIDVLLDKTKSGNLKYRILDVSFKRKE